MEKYDIDFASEEFVKTYDLGKGKFNKKESYAEVLNKTIIRQGFLEKVASEIKRMVTLTEELPEGNTIRKKWNMLYSALESFENLEDINRLLASEDDEAYTLGMGIIEANHPDLYKYLTTRDINLDYGTVHTE